MKLSGRKTKRAGYSKALHTAAYLTDECVTREKRDDKPF